MSDMLNTNKIVAAIFAASTCGGQSSPDSYIQAYGEFLAALKQYDEANKPKGMRDVPAETMRSVVDRAKSGGSL
jgi:hypothetical protein